MTKEILLEVVHHRHSLVKQFGGLAAVHEYCLCSKHLRHLGEDGCSALSHEPVGELTHKRIGGDATESIAATTFQSNAQFAHRHCLSLVLGYLGIQVAQDFHSCLHLVAIHTLCDQKFDALAVIVAKKLFEEVGLVVLAT